jgi:hypothetical protein
MSTMPQTHQNDKGHRTNVIQWPIIWCGEGDLNPHEITPASTSSHWSGFRRVSPTAISLNSLVPLFRCVSRSVMGWLHSGYIGAAAPSRYPLPIQREPRLSAWMLNSLTFFLVRTAERHDAILACGSACFDGALLYSVPVWGVVLVRRGFSQQL